MLESTNPIPDPFPLPITSCGDGNGHYELHYETETSWSGGLRLKEAWLECSTGKETIDLLEKADDLTEEAKSKIEDVTERILESLRDLKEDVPTDTDELQSMANDASHPVTAAILSGLVLLASEISGFGVYALITTILGTIVLTPTGWVFIPAIVYVIFAYRKKLKEQNLINLKSKIEEIDREFEEGDITEEEYRERRNIVIENHFSS